MTFESICWAVAEGEYEGHTTSTRYALVPRDFPRAQYPIHLNITWTMYEPDEYGFPSETESERLEVFEELLVQAVESDGHSVLIAVLTCNGQREFVFQTADKAGFLKRLTDIPHENERYPIEIVANDDPDWGYFEEVIPSTASKN